METHSILLTSPTKNRTSQAGSKHEPMVSVVIPTCNEERILPELFTSIPDTVDENILVNDYSTDRMVK